MLFSGNTLPSIQREGVSVEELFDPQARTPLTEAELDLWTRSRNVNLIGMFDVDTDKPETLARVREHFESEQAMLERQAAANYADWVYYNQTLPYLEWESGLS